MKSEQGLMPRLRANPKCTNAVPPRWDRALPKMTATLTTTITLGAEPETAFDTRTFSTALADVITCARRCTGLERAVTRTVTIPSVELPH
jgi:hypothetical protein